MSNSARLVFVGSLIITGVTVLGVNYYTDEEKKVILLFIKISFIKIKLFRENDQAFFSISIVVKNNVV
jgi:hypothetical protein